MSSRNNGDGCLGQIIALALIFVIGGIVDACQQSQSRLIKEARENNSIGYYETYLDKYPAGRFANEAYDSIVSLWDEMEFKDFQTIPLNASNDGYYKAAINKYEKLTTTYSDPSFQTKLREKLALKCQIQYNIALQQNTLDGWAHYLAHAPEEFKYDSQKKYDALYKEVWGTEKTAWEYAHTRNTASDYEEYERLYPKGKHVKEAEKRAVDLRVDNVFRNEHGTLPAMNKTSGRSGTSSIVSVDNATPYELTVYYSGIDGERLVISPHGRQSVTLTNGNYRIAASVSDRSVRPFAGTENLTGGNNDVRYYISTSRY